MREGQIGSSKRFDIKHDIVRNVGTNQSWQKSKPEKIFKNNKYQFWNIFITEFWLHKITHSFLKHRP